MHIIEKFTAADGAEYGLLNTGAIKHLNPEPYKYDAAYSATYDTPEYTRRSELLQAMRLTFAIGSHGRRIHSLLDVGYGNGAFMNFAAQRVPVVMGLDVTGVPVPDRCYKVEEYVAADVYTFHDCLEHFPDLNFVKHLHCETLVVSLPNCRFVEHGWKWFESWCHRKPSEHIFHFSAPALEATMKWYGWVKVGISNHEDIVRQREGVDWNILTMAFKRK